MEIQQKRPPQAAMSRGLTAAFGSLFVQGSCCYLQRIGAGAACRPNCALLEEE